MTADDATVVVCSTCGWSPARRISGAPPLCDEHLGAFRRWLKGRDGLAPGRPST